MDKGSNIDGHFEIDGQLAGTLEKKDSAVERDTFSA
jgi:hypothetical protein